MKLCSAPLIDIGAPWGSQTTILLSGGSLHAALTRSDAASPGMLIEKATANFKVLRAAQGQSDLLVSRQALRIGNHLCGRRRSAGLGWPLWWNFRVLIHPRRCWVAGPGRSHDKDNEPGGGIFPARDRCALRIAATRTDAPRRGGGPRARNTI